MKIIKYQMMMEVNHGTEENPDIVQTFFPCAIKCSDDVFEVNLAIAQADAYNGEYTIEDDGQPEPEPTEQEQLRADVDFLLAMGGVL